MNNLSTNTDEKKCEYCGTNKTYITVTKKRAPHPKWNNYPFKEDIWICGKCYRYLLYHKALLPSHVRKGLRKARIVRRICHKCGGKIVAQKSKTLYMIVIKCVKQNYTPNDRILDLMETFRKMVNDCIQVGLENN